MDITRELLYSGPVNAISIGGTDLGGTLGGVSVSVDSTYFEITCDQILGIARKKLTDRRCRITFQIAEMSLANLQLALAQHEDNLSDSLLYITDDEQGTTYLEFEVDAPDGAGKWIYYFAIAYISGTGEHSFTKDGQAVVTVEVEAVPDPDNENRFGYIYAEAS